MAEKDSILEALLAKHSGPMTKDMTHMYSDGYRAGLREGFYAGRKSEKIGPITQTMELGRLKLGLIPGNAAGCRRADLLPLFDERGEVIKFIIVEHNLFDDLKLAFKISDPQFPIQESALAAVPITPEPAADVELLKKTDPQKLYGAVGYGTCRECRRISSQLNLEMVCKECQKYQPKGVRRKRY